MLMLHVRHRKAAGWYSAEAFSFRTMSQHPVMSGGHHLVLSFQDCNCKGELAEDCTAGLCQHHVPVSYSCHWQPTPSAVQRHMPFSFGVLANS